jgi:hypothetical protein
MTTKLDRAVYRETRRTTIFSSKERAIICGLEPGDVITLRLKGERKKIEIAVATVFRFASQLDAERCKREKAAAKKMRQVR